MPCHFFDAFTEFGPRPSAHGRQPWTLEHLIDEMAYCDIAGAMVTTTRCATYDAMFENRRLVETLKGHPGLYPIWTVLPHWGGECPQPAQLLAEMQEHDVRAVRLLPQSHKVPLTSRYTRPLLEALAQEAIPLWLNAAIEVPDVTVLETIASELPELPLVVYAIGWARQHEFLPLLLHHRNVHITFDTLQINYGIEWLVEQGCADQLLFASNAPSMSMGAHRFYVDYAEVPAEIRSKIAGGNLTRLLKGLSPAANTAYQIPDPIIAQAREGEPLRDPVIDFHAHILDEGCNHTGANRMWRGGPSGTLALAERMGVEAMGLMSWHGPVDTDAEDGNRCVKAALDALPPSWWGLATFDVIHDDEPTMLAKMREIYADMRFLGIKPYPRFGMPYSDARYDCWWRFAQTHGLYTGIHPTKWYLTDEFESICSRFPDLTVVAYHVGSSYKSADVAIEMAQKYPNFYAEITLTPVCMSIVDYLVDGCGVDRVLYGSDLPMRDPRPQLGWVVYSRLSLEDKKKVMGGNARRLLAQIRAKRHATWRASGQ